MIWHKVRHPASLAMLAATLLILAMLHAAHGRSLRNAVMQADPETVLGSAKLAPATLTRGRAVFVDRCANCHAVDGRGMSAKSVPDLTDATYLYGTGLVAEIEQIVLHGIRSGDPKGWNLASMPAYGRARPYAPEPIQPLRRQDIDDLTRYLMSFQGDWTDRAAIERGKALYAGRGVCWDCHAQDGSGDTAVGAPNLVDSEWIYGGGADAIAQSISNGRAGFSPAFAKSLTAYDVRAVSLYVASLRDAATGRKP